MYYLSLVVVPASLLAYPMSSLLTKGLNEVAFLSNAIVRSPLSLSNTEARIFALALGCLHQKADALHFELHFQDIISSGGKAYQLLDEAIDRLTQPLVSRVKKNGKRSTSRTALFSTIKLDEGTNLIVGQFNSDLKEYLLALSGNFTTVELESLLTLKTAHSQRLFWILKSYQHLVDPEPINYQTLRDWVFGENSDIYAIWTDFNRYLLTPALAEFESLGWQVTVTVQKRGKRVDSLLFKMKNTRLQVAAEAIRKAKKTLTLAEIAEFREELAALYKDLPGLYDRLRLDFQLKEYQAREVVSNIKDLTTYNLATKALHEVRLVLINSNDIKSVAAYTLSQLKAVLPVYQTLGEAAGEKKKPMDEREAKLRQQLQEAQERLLFVENEAPVTLFSEHDKEARLAAIKGEIDNLNKQLGIGK